jgi:hypothetical protein
MREDDQKRFDHICPCTIHCKANRIFAISKLASDLTTIVFFILYFFVFQYFDDAKLQQERGEKQ